MDNHVYELIPRLRRAWVKVPHLRLGQLLIDAVDGDDIFMYGDEELVAAVERFVVNHILEQE